MKTNLLTLVVTLTVGIILAGSLLMPVLTDATTTEKTFVNDGYYRLSETDGETVIIWDTANTPYTITVNGVDFDLSTMGLTANMSYTIAFADDFLLRYFPLGASSNMQIWGSSYSGLGVGQSVGVVATFTITSSGITLEKSDGSATQTASHAGKYFAINKDGDYIMKKSDKTAYVLEDSSIFYAGGISTVGAGGNITSIYFEGSTEEIDYTVMRSGVSVSNSNVIYTDVSDYIGLVNLEKVTFTTTYETGGETYTNDQTYTYFLVPYEVTAELSQHLTPAEIALLNALPFLVIIGLVLAGVGAIFLRNRD